MRGQRASCRRLARLRSRSHGLASSGLRWEAWWDHSGGEEVEPALEKRLVRSQKSSLPKGTGEQPPLSPR